MKKDLIFRIFVLQCCSLLLIDTHCIAQSLNKKQLVTPQKKYSDSVLQQILNKPLPEQGSASMVASSFLKTEQANVFTEWYSILSRGLGKEPEQEIMKQNKSLEKVGKAYLTPEWSIQYAGKLTANNYTPETVAKLLKDKNINILEQLIGNSYPIGQLFFTEQIIIAKIDTIYQNTGINDGMNISCLLSVEKILKGSITSKKLLLRSLPSSMMMLISDSDIAEPIPLQKNQSYMFFLRLEKQNNLANSVLSYLEYPTLPANPTIYINGKQLQKIYDICKDLSDFFKQLPKNKINPNRN
jgi:hypothetical protein